MAVTRGNNQQQQNQKGGFMKIASVIILKFITLMSLWVGGESRAYFFENDLSFSQEQGVLESINTLCLDVWCEGLYSYHFESFKCSFENGECSMTYSYVNRRDDDDYHEEECTIYADSIDDLVEDEYDFELTDEFYNEWHICIDEAYDLMSEE